MNEENNNNDLYENFNLLSIISLPLLLENKYRILVIMVSAFIISVTISLLIPSQYKSSVVLMPVDNEPSSSNSTLAQAGKALGIGMSVQSTISLTQEGITTMQSRLFFEKLINKYDILPLIFPGEWNGKKKIWNDGAPSNEEAYKRFRFEMTTISKDRNTGIVDLNFICNDPIESAKYANLIVEELNLLLRERQIKRSTESIEYLELGIQKTTSIDLRKALANLMQQEARQKMLAETRKEFAFTVIDPAYIPEKRIWPKRKQIVLIGLFIGALLSLFYIVILSRKNEAY